MEEQLTFLIRRWLGWLRLRTAAAWMLQGSLFGLSLALGMSFSLLGRFVFDVYQYFYFVAGLGLGGALLFALAGYFRPLDALAAARFYDRHFSLADRMATAVELSCVSEIPEGGEPPMVVLQRQDALLAGSQVRVGRAFFVQVTRLQALLAALLVCAALLTAALSKPLFAQAQERAAFQQSVDQAIEQLKAAQEKINKDSSLTPDKRLELTQKLENAIRDLEKARTPEQALAALQKAQSDLNANNTAQIQSEANDLHQAGQQLLNQAENKDTPLSSFAKDLAAGNISQAAQDLKQIDSSKLSASDRKQLVEQLAQAAGAVKESNPGLATQLQQASNALNKDDLAATNKALSQASNSLNTAAQNIAQANAAAEAAQQAGQAGQQLAQAGAGAQANSNQGAQSGGQSGQGAGQNGQGLTQGQGQGGSGSGHGSGAGQSGSSGQEVGSQPIGQNNGPGSGGEGLYTPGSTSSHIGGSGGTDVTLPPSQVQDQVIGVQGSNPGSLNTAKGPYQQLGIDPVQTYRKYFDSGEIPSELQSVISSYFSSFSK